MDTARRSSLRLLSGAAAEAAPRARHAAATVASQGEGANSMLHAPASALEQLGMPVRRDTGGRGSSSAPRRRGRPPKGVCAAPHAEGTDATATGAAAAVAAAAVVVHAPVLGDEVALQAAVDHICRVEPRLASVFQHHGLPLKLMAKPGSGFHSLSKSIVSQQVSGKAAASIFARVLESCGSSATGADLTPACVLARTTEQLRACGVSERKASYLLGLAQGFSDGTLSDPDIATMTDEQLLCTLNKLKGVGPWTVDMFAMFHLGRANVLPVGDLAVRKGIQSLFNLKAEPSAAEMRALTAAWEPYRSVGSWCMWHLAPAAAADVSTPAKKKRKAVK